MAINSNVSFSVLCAVKQHPLRVLRSLQTDSRRFIFCLGGRSKRILKMVYLDNNAFISELSRLYAANEQKGSVWMTMKRLERPLVTGRGTETYDTPVCIVRATDGKKKIATAVEPGEHLRFHMDLFTVIKASTKALQKPKRTRKPKN